MNQGGPFHDVDQQQTEQELFDSLLNLNEDNTYDDVWQPEPSYQFPNSEDYTANFSYSNPSVPSQLHQNGRRSLDLSPQLPLDSWKPHTLLPQSDVSGRGRKSRRGLPRKRSAYFTSRAERASTPVPIPNVSSFQTYSLTDLSHQFDPLQRWRNSPPEHEPATISAINRALHDTPTLSPNVQTSMSPKVQPRSTSAPILVSSFHTYRQASSRASSESGLSESSQLSTTSTKSHNLTRLHARRATKAKAPKDTDKTTRRFKCTFCCDDFRTKYDWSRHEKSLHLDIEEWRCCPHGSMVFSTITDRIHCAYCNALDPSLTHLEAHNYAICDNPESPTTFHRKDHLVQHLRLAHHLESLPLIDDWKVTTATLHSRCGFCNTKLNTWDERTAHLSEHFRQGLTMTSWRGDHGFDATIAAKVRNAIPPYIIGDESRALIPFKAGDAKTQDHFNQISRYMGNIDLGRQVNAQTQGDDQNDTSNDFYSDHNGIDGQGQVQAQVPGQGGEQSFAIQEDPSGYLDILTRHLGRFAREQMMRGVIPTDEMFQSEARKLIYDGDADGWDTTVADNDYWLSEFKAQFGAGG